MYRVAICDDDKFFSESEESTCRNILDKMGIEYRIDVFESGSCFLASFCGDRIERYDLILLDIIMGGLNGMELAEEIRKFDNDVSIIFVTSSQQYALQGYDVRALNYLSKPLDRSKLERLITSDYYNKYQNSFLIFKTGVQTLRIPISDIVRLETTGRRVAITLRDKIVFYPGKLTELLEQLPKDQIVRCHQAYAINLRNTKELTRSTAYATNGVETPISRTFAKEVQKAFLKSIREF